MEPQEYAQLYSLEERHWWYRALRRRILAILRRYAILGTPSGRYLDAGCGTGMLLTTLPPAAVRCGFDLSPIALGLARRRGNAHLARAGVEAIPVASASMDAVFSADVIYHRAVRDDLAALQEMARTLRPGGLLVLNVPAFSWLMSAHDRAIHTARRYTAGEVRRKLRRAGLQPLRVRYWNWLLFPALVAVRLLLRRARDDAHGAPASDLVAHPVWIDRLLSALMRLEEGLAFLPIPWGLSILAVARKESHGISDPT